MTTQQDQAHTPLCPAWIWSTGSNVHISKDRGWFTDYIPLEIESFVTDAIFKVSRLPVLGYGTVEIPTKCPPGSSRSHAILRLENVIHVPTAICNIMGRSFGNEYTITPAADNSTISAIAPNSNLETGLVESIAYFDYDNRPFQLILSESPVGPVVGEYVWKEGTSHNVSLIWPNEEMIKVLATLKF